MKVAIVYHFFPHYRAAVMRELLASLENDYLLVGDDRAVDPTIKMFDVEDRARFVVAPCQELRAPLLLQKGLLKLALRKDLETIVYLGNPYYLSTWLSALLARLTGKRVLFWTHGWTRAEGGLKSWLRRMFYMLPHSLLLYGHMAKTIGIGKGFLSQNLHVIYNSLDYETQKKIRASITLDQIASLRRKLFADPNRPMVVCTARLTKECRFDLLLEAQAKLKAEGYIINVLLVGDGTERASLEAMATQLDLPVKFFGACYDEATLAGLLMAANVTVSPGKVGLTAMHSLAYGTPVVTHNDFQAQGPEWEAILPGKTGDFFRRNDAADLARTIRAWTRTELPDASVRAECHRIIDKFYNPGFQCRAIDRAVRGEPADDLFWMKEIPCQT